MSAAIVNKFMRMMGIGENDEDNEYDDEVDCYDEEEQDEVENREVPKARRSIRDICLIVKYYFPEVTFEQVLGDVVELYNEQFINGSFCNDVRLYVFYTDQISSVRNSDRTLELSRELTVKDLINYFNNK